MKTNPQLTSLQLSILRVLWTRGEARVPEVCEGLKSTRNLAKNTIATMLSRLEKQGIPGAYEGSCYCFRICIRAEFARFNTFPNQRGNNGSKIDVCDSESLFELIPYLR